ncbi:MAG: hypothetical protein ACOYK1_02635 [Vampirovibrionia bacterium]
MNLKTNLFLTKEIIIRTPEAACNLGLVGLAGAVILTKNIASLPSMRLGNLVTVDGKASGAGMLSEQGQSRIKKELQANPENAELLNIKIKHPAVYVLDNIINLADNVININTPYVKNYQIDRVESLLEECDEFNRTYHQVSKNFRFDQSAKKYDLLTSSAAKDSRAEQKYQMELSGSLDSFAVRFLTDKQFADSVNSLGLDTSNFKKYIDNKLEAILLEKHEAEPIYENAFLSLKKILDINNAHKLVNRFLRSDKCSSNSLLKRFLPAIREYRVNDNLTEEYKILELILNNSKIDKSIQQHLRTWTDIPKSLLDNKNATDDDLIIKLKKEKLLLQAFKHYDQGDLQAAKSEYIKYTRSIANTEQFTFAVQLMPDDLKKDIAFVKSFSTIVNNKFLNNSVKLKVDIHKTEREASMFSNRSPINTPEYRENDWGELQRIKHERLHKYNWGIEFDWSFDDIEKTCKDLDLHLAWNKVYDLCYALGSSRSGDFSKTDSRDLSQTLDMICLLEKFVPAAYIPSLLDSGKLNAEGIDNIHQHIEKSGFYYQALILKEIKSERRFNETLDFLVSNLKNSNDMYLFQEKLSLFDINQELYKEKFLARVLEKDFTLLSNSNKEDFVMNLAMEKGKNLTIPYSALESNLEETEFMTVNHFFQRQEDKMLHVFSIGLDKTNGQLNLVTPKEDVKIKLNGTRVNSRFRDDEKIKLKVGDFLSVSNAGKTDLYYVGLLEGHGPVLNLVTKAKAELFDSLVSAKDRTLEESTSYFRKLGEAIMEDKTGSMISALLNPIESINTHDRSAPTLVWTGDSYSVEDYVYGNCPHTISYESKINGFEVLRGELVTHELSGGPSDLNQAHPFLKLLSTFLPETRPGNQGGAKLLGPSQELSLTALESENNSMISLNEIKISDFLLSPPKPESSTSLPLIIAKEIGLEYSLEKSIREQFTRKKQVIEKIKESKDTFDLTRALKEYQSLEPDSSQLTNIFTGTIETKFNDGHISAKTTQLAQELNLGGGLPLVDELANELERTGLAPKAKETVRDFRSDRDLILEALENLNQLSLKDQGGSQFSRAIDLLNQVKDFRRTINFIYPTLAAEEKEKPNTITPFLFSLYDSNLENSKQAIDPLIYKQIREDFSKKDIYNQIEFLSRVKFFKKELDVSDLIEAVCIKVNDSDNLAKLLDEFRLYDFEDDILRGAIIKSSSREEFQWHMSEEEKSKILLNLASDEPITIPESSLIFDKNITEYSDNYNYDLFIYRDLEKKFLGRITLDPSSETIKYKPTSKCGNYPLEEAYVNGFLVDGTADVKLKAADILQLADDTFYVSTLDDAKLGLSLIGKGNAKFLKTMFFDQHRMKPEQGQMPECAYSALVYKMLYLDQSAVAKKTIFEGIGLGYDYRKEPCFRIKINSHQHLPTVEPWRQRLIVNSGLHGVDINVKGDSQFEFRVEYPYLSSLHSMQPGSFVFSPMNFYHGGFKEGSPGVSIYGFAAKKYIGGEGYVNNFPQADKIIRTFWQDYSNDSLEQNDLTKILSKMATLHLDEIIRDIHDSCLIFTDSFDRKEANPVLLKVYEMMNQACFFSNPDLISKKLSNPDYISQKLVGKDNEELKRRLSTLTELIDDYNNLGSLDTHTLQNLLIPVGTSNKQPASLALLEQHLANDSQLIILGTPKGEEDFRAFLKESQTPGNINTIVLRYNRFYQNQYIPDPKHPLAAFYTPVRSFLHGTSRTHAYVIDGLNTANQIRMRDSVYFNKQFPYQTFTDHYSIQADLWTPQKDEKTIIKFST